MSEQSGYKNQKNLSFGQFLSEVPNFIAVLISAIVSGSLITFVDLLDSFGNLLRTGITSVLSKKLVKDLKFEYNYGVGKLEALSSLMCEGIVFFGLLSMVGLSVYEIVFPSKPSDLLIAVVGLKIINVSFDVFFFVGQYRIVKNHHSAVSNTSLAAAIGALLFDIVALVSLLAVWLLRNNYIGLYLSPAISIIIAIYLMLGCVKRIKRALYEITDKTLSEDLQLKILSVMTMLYDRYYQLHSVRSHRDNDRVCVDLYVSFNNDTTFEEIVRFKQDVWTKLNNSIENCVLNIVIQETSV